MVLAVEEGVALVAALPLAGSDARALSEAAAVAKADCDSNGDGDSRKLGCALAERALESEADAERAADVLAASEGAEEADTAPLTEGFIDADRERSAEADADTHAVTEPLAGADCETDGLREAVAEIEGDCVVDDVCEGADVTVGASAVLEAPPVAAALGDTASLADCRIVDEGEDDAHSDTWSLLVAHALALASAVVALDCEVDGDSVPAPELETVDVTLREGEPTLVTDSVGVVAPDALAASVGALDSVGRSVSPADCDAQLVGAALTLAAVLTLGALADALVEIAGDNVAPVVAGALAETLTDGVELFEVSELCVAQPVEDAKELGSVDGDTPPLDEGDTVALLLALVFALCALLAVAASEELGSAVALARPLCSLLALVNPDADFEGLSAALWLTDGERELVDDMQAVCDTRGERDALYETRGVCETLDERDELSDTSAVPDTLGDCATLAELRTEREPLGHADGESVAAGVWLTDRERAGERE